MSPRWSRVMRFIALVIASSLAIITSREASRAWSLASSVTSFTGSTAAAVDGALCSGLRLGKVRALKAIRQRAEKCHLADVAETSKRIASLVFTRTLCGQQTYDFSNR